MTTPRHARAGEQQRTQRGVLSPVRTLLVTIGGWLLVTVASGLGPVAAQDPEPAVGPVELALVIDTSGSMFGEPLEAAASAARACIADLPAGSAAGVIGYATRPAELHPLSTDRVSVSRSLDALVAVGETATHDALIAGSRLFPVPAGDAPDPAENRYVVLLTDGNDTASQRGATDAADAVRGVGANLWVVAVETGDSDLASLDDLASQGDAALIRTGPGDLVRHCREIVDEIVEQQRQLAVARASAPPGSSTGGSPGSDGSGVGTSSSSDDVGSIAGGDGNGDLDAAAFPEGDDSGMGAASESAGGGAAGTGMADVPLGANSGEGSTEGTAEFPQPPPNLASATDEVAASARALWVGAIAIFFSLATMFGIVFVPSHSAMVAKQMKLRFSRPVQDTPKRAGGLGRIADSTSVVIESIMTRRGIGASLNDSLDAAGINLRPSEFVAATGALGLVITVLGSVLANPILFIVGIVGVPLVARQVLTMRSAKRTKLFQDQLVETLMLMSGSLRAGHGLMQSISSVAEQASEPTSTEFGRVITEVRIGRDPIDSLKAMADRVGSMDLTWIVRAMALNRELGGNLAEILDNVADTIRERNKIADQVRALSAEGKFSAYVLFGLPFGVVFAVRILNPEYIEPLFNTTKGYTIIGVSLTLMTIGAIWIRNMIKIEY